MFSLQGNNTESATVVYKVDDPLVRVLSTKMYWDVAMVETFTL